MQTSTIASSSTHHILPFWLLLICTLSFISGYAHPSIHSTPSSYIQLVSTTLFPLSGNSPWDSTITQESYINPSTKAEVHTCSFGNVTVSNSELTLYTSDKAVYEQWMLQISRCKTDRASFCHICFTDGERGISPRVKLYNQSSEPRDRPAHMVQHGRSSQSKGAVILSKWTTPVDHNQMSWFMKLLPAHSIFLYYGSSSMDYILPANADLTAWERSTMHAHIESLARPGHAIFAAGELESRMHYAEDLQQSQPFDSVSLITSWGVFTLQPADSAVLARKVIESVHLSPHTLNSCPPRKIVFVNLGLVKNLEELKRQVVDEFKVEVEIVTMDPTTATADQVRPFHDAGLVVVGYSGASLNALFSHPKSAMVQVMSEFTNPEYFWYLQSVSPSMSFWFALGGTIVDPVEIPLQRSCLHHLLTVCGSDPRCITDHWQDAGNCTNQPKPLFHPNLHRHFTLSLPDTMKIIRDAVESLNNLSECDGNWLSPISPPPLASHPTSSTALFIVDTDSQPPPASCTDDDTPTSIIVLFCVTLAVASCACLLKALESRAVSENARRRHRVAVIMLSALTDLGCLSITGVIFSLEFHQSIVLSVVWAPSVAIFNTCCHIAHYASKKRRLLKLLSNEHLSAAVSVVFSSTTWVLCGQTSCYDTIQGIMIEALHLARLIPMHAQQAGDVIASKSLLREGNIPLLSATESSSSSPGPQYSPSASRMDPSVMTQSVASDDLV